MDLLEQRIPLANVSLEKQPANVLLAMLVWGEARGEADEVKLAVAGVVRNRARFRAGKFGPDWPSVILAPLQFSCFNTSDPNRDKLLHPLDHDTPEAWQRCYLVANLVYFGIAHDLSRGADHYFDSSIPAPSWAAADRQTVLCGRMRFFRLDQPMATAPKLPEVSA